MYRRGRVTPKLDTGSNKALNLTVLQRIDPAVEEILFTSWHVSLYQFDIDENQWRRKNVEGTLFVVKKNATTRFQFIVMNQRNTDNLVENLLGDFEYETQGPYLLYRNSKKEVNGIWFYNAEECESVGNLFSRILTAFSKVKFKPEVPSGKSEIEESEAESNIEGSEGPGEPLESASTSTSLPEDRNILNFFPNLVGIEGPQEPSKSAFSSTSLHKESDILKFEAMTTLSDALDAENSRQHGPPAVAVPLAAQVSSPASSSAPIASIPPLDLSASSSSILETPASINSCNLVSNLVTPSSLLVSSASASLMMPSVSFFLQHPAAHIPILQPACTNPMLQPFPPRPLRSSTTAPLNIGSLLSRDKVRHALLMLVQDDQFVNTFYRALLRATSYNNS